MIKTILITCLVSLAALLVQTTWIGHGLIGGVVPDITLLVLIWVAYYNTNNEGVIAAFISGLEADIVSSSPLGYMAFLYVVPAYALSLLRDYIVLDTLFLPALFGIGGTLLKWLASAVLAALFGAKRVNSYSLADYHFWLEAGMNGALAPLIFKLLSFAKKWLITKSRKG